MGCGKSKFTIIYPSRKHRSSSKSYKDTKLEVETKNERIETSEERRKIAIDRGRQFISTPLLHMADISSSQQDFFKMLDAKIESGPDYKSESEGEDDEHEYKKYESSSSSSSTTLFKGPQESIHQIRTDIKKSMTTNTSNNINKTKSIHHRKMKKLKLFPHKTSSLLPTVQASPPPHTNS